MEDQLYVNVSDHDWSAFGVFDGHAGKTAAIIAKRLLPRRILQRLTSDGKEAKDTKQVHVIFIEECAKLQAEMHKKQMKSGTTAVMMFHHAKSNMIHALWVGDSRAIVVTENGDIEFKTIDHKPTEKIERTRIMDSGGFIEDDEGTARVNGYLSLSRAFGDFIKPLSMQQNKQHEYDPVNSPLIAVPECASFAVPNKPFVLLLACDGLWDVFTNEEIASEIHNIQNKVECKAFLQKLTTEAIQKRHSYDNVSIIMVRFAGQKGKVVENEHVNLETLFSKLTIKRHVRSRKTTKKQKRPSDRKIHVSSGKRRGLRSETRQKHQKQMAA